MTGWKWLVREWRGGRSGDLSILIFALTLSVAIVAGIGLFTDRIQQELDRESATYLAADLTLWGRSQHPGEYLDKAREFDLEVAQNVTVLTMAYPDAESSDGILVALKAASRAHPLRGQLEVTSNDGVDYSNLRNLGTGEALVEQQYLDRAGVSIGDSIYIGELPAKIVGVINKEPDGGFEIIRTGPRVIINLTDIHRTMAIGAGSRAGYTQLYAGDEDNVQAFKAWLEEQVEDSNRISSVEDERGGPANAVVRARSFLLLCGSLGVALAGVALALAGRRYSEYLLDAVAVQKTLGATPKRVTQLLVGKLFWIWLIGTALGLVIAFVVQMGITAALKEWFDQDLPAPGLASVWMGVVTSLVSLVAFLGPPIYQLQGVPPLRVIRRELGSVGSTTTAMIIGIAAFAGLLLLYTNSPWVMLGLIVGLLVAGVIAVIIGQLIFGGKRRLIQASSPWRLAMSSLRRHKWLSVGQVIAFALTIHLIAIAVMVRTSLLSEWEDTVPEDAPNYFFTNIAPYQQENVEFTFDFEKIDDSRLYPLVRGRITKVNGEDAKERAEREELRYISRELNLTYAEEQPIDNEIIHGYWWEPDTEEFLVSVEADVAEDMGLKLADKITFEIGGIEVEAMVSSIRTLNWDDIRPAFFMVLSPPALESFGGTLITSAYVPDDRPDFIPVFLRQFPTVTVIDVGFFIEQVRTVIGQVSQAVELVLSIVALSALLVLMATVRASQDWRRRESALLRALGASKRRLIGAIVMEFGWLGFSAGVLAVLMTEAALAIIQVRQFDMSASFHWELWYTLPFISAALVTFFGWLTSRSVVHVPPNQLLREVA